MRGHEVALWAGVAALFGSLLTIGAIDFLNPGDRAQFVGALFVALITGGSVYAKERLNEAKQKEKARPTSTR
jgi:hypothetical protein